MSKRKLIDWLDVYSSLSQAGLIDTHLHWGNFQILPMRTIAILCNKAVEIIRCKANVDSIAIAQLGVVMSNIGMSFLTFDGVKPPVPRAIDFLPFPTVFKDDEATLKLSKKAQGIIRQLIKTDSCRFKLISAVSAYMDLTKK